MGIGGLIRNKSLGERLRPGIIEVKKTSFSSGPSHNELLNLRNFSIITPHLEKEIHIYSNKKEIPVSLKSLMETGKGDKLNRFDELVKGKYAPQTVQPQASQKILIQVACFLHRELPVRLAHRAVRLESSPLFVKSSKYQMEQLSRID
jgi:hypothetical protein